MFLRLPLMRIFVRVLLPVGIGALLLAFITTYTSSGGVRYDTSAVTQVAPDRSSWQQRSGTDTTTNHTRFGDSTANYTSAGSQRTVWRIQRQNTIKQNWTYDSIVTPEERDLYFKNIDFELLRRRSLNGSFLQYLPDYRNPCWVEQLDSDQSYDDNPYGIAYKPALRVLEGIFKKRLKSGHGWRTRCLPYVYVIGVGKSGTTDLYNLLSLHPDIVQPVIKETMYWHRGRFAGRRNLSDYLDLFDAASEIIRAQPEGDSGIHTKITFENTPSYLWHYDIWRSMRGENSSVAPRHTLADTLHRVFPQARIMAMLRNPVDRLYSHYTHFREKRSSPEDFDRLARRGLSNMKACLETHTVRACIYNPELNGEAEPVFIRASMYHPFLRDWLKVFPREQVHIVRSEDYYRGRLKSLNRIFKFLQLDPLPDNRVKYVAEIKKYNMRTYTSMLDSTRQMLTDFYQPFNKKLAQLLQDDRFLWK